MSEEDSIPISGCFSSNPFGPLGPKGCQIVAPPEAPSAVGGERGWGTEVRKCESPACGAKQCRQVEVHRMTYSIPCTRNEDATLTETRSSEGAPAARKNSTVPISLREFDW